MFGLLFFISCIVFFIMFGMTLVSFVAALAFGAIVMFVVGMLGAALKMLPWIILALVALYFYKQHLKQQYFD